MVILGKVLKGKDYTTFSKNLKAKVKDNTFIASFRKKDKSIRTMSCHLTDIDLTERGFDPLIRGLLPVWEEGKGHKFVNLNSLIYIQFQGIKYK